MNLRTRANRRDLLVKMAAERLTELKHHLTNKFISDVGHKLEGLNPGDKIFEQLPVGRENFPKWLKQECKIFPELTLICEDEGQFGPFMSSVAEEIESKGVDRIKNPLKKYKPTKDTILERASVKNTKINKQAEDASAGEMYSAPGMHTRHCPEHPGSMLTRVSDGVYRCPISGTPEGAWKENYSYKDGHEVKFEMGVQNQTNEARNDMFDSVLPFLSDRKSEIKGKNKSYDYDKLYNFTRDVEEADHKGTFGFAGDKDSEEKAEKEASIAGITRRASDKKEEATEDKLESMSGGTEYKGQDAFKPFDEHFTTREYDCAEMGNSQDRFNGGKSEASLIKGITKKAQYNEAIFGPTTVPTRQCPDHPGQQMSRIADNVRQCPLDGKVYDFTLGFTTNDGVKHPGGAVQNQHAFPPGSVILKAHNSGISGIVKTADNQTRTFLNADIKPFLEPNSRGMRVVDKVLVENKAFDKAVSEVAREDEFAHQNAEKETTQPAQAQPAIASIKGLTRSAGRKNKDSCCCGKDDCPCIKADTECSATCACNSKAKQEAE